MNKVKKIIVFPIIIVLTILSRLINLIIKAEYWVAGVGFLLLAIFAVLAAISHQWLQFRLFMGMMGVEVLLLLLSVSILICIDFALEKVK